MLVFKLTDEVFYVGTLFSTKKPKKSSRGNVYCQLFFMGKGVAYDVHVNSKIEVPWALK